MGLTTEMEETLEELFQQRSILENRLDELELVLSIHKSDMDTPLVDCNGYPRADIDIATVRATRAQIIRLRNDFKALMVKIQRKVESGFNSGIPKSQSAVVNKRGPVETVTQPAKPFAIVNSVAEGSPASEAGLRKDDQLVKFGHVESHNHNELQMLRTEVERAMNCNVKSHLHRN